MPVTGRLLSETIAANQKLQQQPVIHLPKLGGEKLKSISSMGSARQPRTSTPVESVSLRPPETESMEVDTRACRPRLRTLVPACQLTL